MRGLRSGHGGWGHIDMSDAGSQTTLSGEEVEGPEDGETLHARIVRWCHSEGLRYILLGYSLKILVEGGIVAGVLALLVLIPLIGAAWYGVEQVTYFRAGAAWASGTVTIYAAAFCLLENVTHPEEMFATKEDGD